MGQLHLIAGQTGQRPAQRCRLSDFRGKLRVRIGRRRSGSVCFPPGCTCGRHVWKSCVRQGWLRWCRLKGAGGHNFKKRGAGKRVHADAAQLQDCIEIRPCSDTLALRDRTGASQLPACRPFGGDGGKFGIVGVFLRDGCRSSAFRLRCPSPRSVGLRSRVRAAKVHRAEPVVLSVKGQVGKVGFRRGLGRNAGTFDPADKEPCCFRIGSHTCVSLLRGSRNGEVCHRAGRPPSCRTFAGFAACAIR